MVGAYGVKEHLNSKPRSNTYQLYDALDELLSFNELDFLLFQKTALTIYRKMVFRIRNHECKVPSTVPGK